MNDDIKKILGRLERIDHKEYSCAFEFADSASFDEMCRCFEERKILADYITNLQQENENLKENNKNMQEEMCKCWGKIDKAIEYINTFKNDIRGLDEIVLLNILQNGSEE